MKYKEEKLTSILQRLIGEYMSRLDFNNSFVGVNRVELSKDLKIAGIFIGVYPEQNEKEALKTIKSKTAELRKNIKKNIRTRILPKLEFYIDEGEKNRQRVEELLQKV